jgi:hypothetical protein
MPECQAARVFRQAKNTPILSNAQECAVHKPDCESPPYVNILLIKLR